MAYTIISQNNNTTTLSDGVNTITVPSRVNLTSGNFTIVEVNNNMATLEDGDGNVYRDIPCVATLAGEGGGGAVSSVNGKTGAVVLTAEDVGAVPQLSELPTADVSNVGNIVQYVGATTENYTNGYFYQNQPTYSDPSATISQTTGSGLTDLTVDAVKFSEQESETGGYDFVKYITPSSYNLESGQPGFSVEMDADTVKERLTNGGHDATQFYLGYSGGSYQIGYDANTLYYSGITASGLYNNFSITVPENPDESAEGTWGIFVYADGSDGWKLNNNDVNISDYGIEYTGNPSDGDVLTVAYTAPAVIGYQWNQKDVQPAGNGGGQEIEYSDIIYDPQTDTDTPIGWVTEFENLPTGDYYFYVKTAKYTSTQGGDQPIWQTNKICFHWDSTWSGNTNIDDFKKTILVAPVLDGDFVGDVTQNTLLNVGDSPVFVHYNSSGNKYALSVYNTALVETVSGNMYSGVGGVVYKVSKLYGGIEPLGITLGKKYVYDYNVSGYQYYTLGGNTNPILPQPEPLKSKCTNQQYVVSNFTDTYRVFEIQSTMYPTDSRISSIRISSKCSGGELDAYVYFRYGMGMYQVIKKATGVFANSRLYKRENYTTIYVSLDYSAFALLPDQSEPVYAFCAIFGTGSETEPNITLNSVDVSTTGFTMLDFDKSGVRLAMDLPTVETLGGVVQYVGETDANYTKGYFYEAAGTIVNVPMGGTITNVDPSGASVTIDYEELVDALMNAMGWDRSYTVGLLTEYSGYTDTWNVSDNTLTLDGIAMISLDTYPNIATFADYGAASQVTFAIENFQDAHQELQNGSWVRVDVQPGSSLPSQTGNAGKFLTTDGTDASWAAISALQNTATQSSSVGIATTNPVTTYHSVVVGPSATSTDGTNIAIGEYAKAEGVSAISICPQDSGYTAKANSIIIGGTKNPQNYQVRVGSTTGNANEPGYGSIVLGSGRFESTDGAGNGEFWVFLSQKNGTYHSPRTYKVMDYDGTIPTARLTKVNSTITLTAAGWSSNTQTVTVSSMTATGVVLVSPDPTDQADYTSAGIICTAQAADSLTFTCSTTPTADINVNVVML